MYNTPGGSVYASGPRGDALRDSQRITHGTTSTPRANPVDLRRITITPPRESSQSQRESSPRPE